MLSLITLFCIFSETSFAAPPYQVRVTNIRFTGGIGRGPTSNPPDTITEYYRGYGYPGTYIEITAEMSTDGGITWGAPMYGPVQFTIQYAAGYTFNVTLDSGTYTGTAALPYNFDPGQALLTTGSTTGLTYTATAASGDYVSGLTSSSSTTLFWDRGDAPSSGTPAITWQGTTITTTSMTIYWSPVTTVHATFDRDFYEYRVYYRELGASTYKQWNGANDPALRGLANNPEIITINDTARHIDANGFKYTTIPNLKVFTAYEYFITAVDIFGNEISEANAGPGLTDRLIRTKPLKLTVSISDGITQHSDFSDLTNPALRTLRNTNIKVNIYTVTDVDQPDSIKIWFAPAVPDTNIITSTNVPDEAGLGATLDSIGAQYAGPNTWIAYIPTIPGAGKNRILQDGNDIRFIIELSFRGIPTYVDYNSDDDPNDAEWNFHIGTATTFTPWPTRILNNVITDKNPTAYPSYYLSEDAYVTIIIYDVKGRPVVTLQNEAYRRGGQNIKENGWSGANKSQKMVGVGLYYIHIKAKSSANGKTLIDKFEKVVVRK